MAVSYPDVLLPLSNTSDSLLPQTDGPGEMVMQPAERSKQIDAYLKKEKVRFKNYMRKTMRLLLVGAGESGKSTIVKQMKILHKGGFNDSERHEFIPIIMENVRESIVTLIEAMSRLRPSISLKSPELEASARYMTTFASDPATEVTQEFFDHTQRLWEDEGVQTCFLRGNEFQLLDSAKYYLDKLDEIRDPDFMPSDQDILRSRKMTKGVVETWFEVNNINFHMLDVGGQRDERKKWLQCFSDITALIFVAACSGFDSTLREDKSMNRLTEALTLYEMLWKNRFLKETSVILFLNKEDILKEKVASGRTRMQDYFPDFDDFIPPPTLEPTEKYCCGCCVTKSMQIDQRRRESAFPELSEMISIAFYKSKCFIKEKFAELNVVEKEVKFRKNFYPHFTSAVDTENIKKVFHFCEDIVQRENLRKYELL